MGGLLLVGLLGLAACGPESPPSSPGQKRATRPAGRSAGTDDADGVDDIDPYEAWECQLRAARRSMRERIRAGELDEAQRLIAEQVRSWPAEAGGEVDETATYLLTHARWLGGLDARLTELGVVYLERPRRMYVQAGGARARRDPGGTVDERGSSLWEDQPVDVWADGPAGAVLVAFPGDAPDFAVGGDPFALVGWLTRGEVVERPSVSPTLDVGRPLDVWRGPPIESLSVSTPGHPCSTCGAPGLGFDLYGSEIRCVLLEEMCGSPGLTPPVYDPSDGWRNGCADCPTPERTFVGVGDYCRGAEPGWTWRCAPGGEHLVCTAPGAVPEAVAGPPDEPAASVPPVATAAEELAAIAAAARDGDLVEAEFALHFHAHASPGALFRLACASEMRAASREALFGALRMSRFFDRFVDASALRCVERLALESEQLQFEIAQMPDPRIRSTLEAIAWSERQHTHSVEARAALAVLDARGRALQSTVVRIATEDDLLFGFLRSYVRYTSDPRPLFPVLVELLGRGDLSVNARRNMVHALSEIAGRSFGAPDEARAFWVANRANAVDAWLVESSLRPSAADRRRAYRLLGRRVLLTDGRDRLLAGLEEEDPEMRYVAAVSLARWGDRRAVPVLAAFLPRAGALFALGRLHDSTFGYDYQAPLSARRAAVARWRAWASSTAD